MKFFFDNMFPPGLPPYIQSFNKSHDVKHLKELFPGSTKDDEWITQLAKDGHWNIVTIDLNISSTPHLNKALQVAGHTAFFLKKGWASLGIEDLSWKYPKAWWEIEKVANKHVGKGVWFSVSVSGKAQLMGP